MIFRTKNWAVVLAVPLLAAISAAQEAPPPDQIFSSDLIAWTNMQQPQPPESRGGQTSPNPSAKTTSGNTSPDSATDQNQAGTANTFTGTVTKEGDGFVLQVSETTKYKLDAQQQVKQYEGQRVRVTGTLESGGEIIHVDRIEPLS
jgi:hypothetical protein